MRRQPGKMSKGLPVCRECFDCFLSDLLLPTIHPMRNLLRNCVLHSSRRTSCCTGYDERCSGSQVPTGAGSITAFVSIAWNLSVQVRNLQLTTYLESMVILVLQ